MKKKIAVIGGGLGSLSTVYYLMNQPNAKELYDITIYQESWNLGGKGASGVNREKGFRVEEHGIHFWFGFYENAFHLMKQVYKGLNRPDGAPLATFEDAFKPQEFMDFAQQINDKWTNWEVKFPPLPGSLGDGKFLYPIEELVEIGVKMIADQFHEITHHLKEGCFGLLKSPFRSHQPPKHPTHEAYLTKFEEKIAHSVEHRIERRLLALANFYKDPQHHNPKDKETHANYIFAIKKWIWDHLGHLISKNPDLARVWCIIDFGTTVLRGVIQDGVLHLNGKNLALDFTKINQYDFTAWLIRHDADKHFIYNVPAVKSMYDGPFAFFKGAISTPDVEAGTALNIFFRLAFTCKENIMFRMQAGMGDTIFAPIYQFFKQEFSENVHFSFFHKAKNLKLSEDKKKVVEMEFDRLIDLADQVKEYQPFVNVKGLDCWPSEPLYEQLNQVQAAEIKDKKIKLCSDWSGWKGHKVTKKLGFDYDDIIIGASLAALPGFCNELIRSNSKWADMLDSVGTVQTQAFQLWFSKGPEELGVEPLKILSTYVEPLDTLAGMDQILTREDWSKFPEKPKYILYVCGAMIDSESIPHPDSSYFPFDQEQEVFENMMHYVLNDLRFVLPKAFDENGHFDWNVLFDPTGGTGPERLKYQYFRANIDRTERYVFSLSDTSRYRLKTDESGFENVFLTGDWIQNGMNIGFVEGAVISGILAARAVSGDNNIPLFIPW